MNTAANISLDDLKTIAIRQLDKRRDELIRLSNDIHSRPETAFNEHEAVKMQTECLKANGFTVTTGFRELPTAYVAAYRATQPGPTVALLAEYDALPEMGHACGHNIIAAASVGAAIVLRELMDDLHGTLMVIGTPAEEYGGGKITLADQGVFSGVDAAMIVHPSTRTCAVCQALANQTFDVEFFGRAAHAAAYPEQGINALDAMLLSYMNINSLRQHLRMDARVHGIITHGGEASNIVPAYSSGRFQVRAKDDKYLDEVMERVLDCFNAGALATGARFEHHLKEKRYMAMVNNIPMANAFNSNLRNLGIQPDFDDPARGFGSTDMGNVSQIVPSIHPSIAIADAPVALHTPEFAVAAASDRGNESLILAAKALALTTIDLLMDSDLLVRVKKDFAASV